MIDIRLFGPLCLSGGTVRLGPRDFGGVKPKQILEILLLNRGRPVAKDRLADLLWGENLPRNVCASLETYVSVLRRSIGALPGGAGLVVTQSGAYRLDTSRYCLDLDRFDALAAEITTAPPHLVRRLLQRAIALVEGEVLADEPYADWAAESRNVYDARHTDLIIRAAHEALIERELHAALAQARRAVELAPLSEQAWRVAMTALYALARRTSALKAFQRCRAILSQELGVDPSAETLALRAAIEREEDPERLLPAERRIIAGGSRPRETPPARPFFGRREVLAQVAGLVDEALAGAFTTVLIEGEAGMGKTRLLEEVVRGLEASGRPARLGTARGRPFERRRPGGLLGEALRGPLADLEGRDDLLAAVFARRGGAWLALERLAITVAEAAPIVLVFDDIHFADPASLSGLAFLSRRCRTAPVAVLASARPETLSCDHHLLRQLELEARLRLEVIPQGQVPGLCPRLWAKTGGHPQLLFECVAAGVTEDGAQRPQRLVDVVLARAQEVGHRAHRILATASVFADPFRAEDLAAILDLSPTELVEELEHLCERGFLMAQGTRFVFRIEMIREILLASLSPARRELLIRRTQPTPTRPALSTSFARPPVGPTAMAALAVC